MDSVEVLNGTLTQKQVKRIQEKYFIFGRNRSNYLSQKSHKRQTEEIARETLVQHRPDINDKSRRLTLELHQNLNENQIPHYEFLLLKGREYERNKRESRNEKEASSNSNCTFYPDVSIASSLYDKRNGKRNGNSRNSQSTLSKLLNTATLEKTTEKLDTGNPKKRDSRRSPIGTKYLAAISSQKFVSKKLPKGKDKIPKIKK